MKLTVPKASALHILQLHVLRNSKISEPLRSFGCSPAGKNSTVFYLTYFHDGFCWRRSPGTTQRSGRAEPSRCLPPSSSGASDARGRSIPAGDGIGRCCQHFAQRRKPADGNPPAPQGSVGCRWWIPGASERSFPPAAAPTRSQPHRGNAWPSSVWFALPSLGSWSLEVRGLKNVLSSNYYHAGYRGEVGSESVLHRIVGNKYSIDSALFFSP